jgi:2',3'-cyclic-nucleotide 2'-phosphodiesterase (5'-nucleotidase family)
VIKDLKKGGKELLILDAGNSLFAGKGSPSSPERKKARLIAAVYQRISYRAVNVGSHDLLAGIEFLKGLQRDARLPLLSANLLDEEGGKPLFKPHMVLNIDGTRIGLFGITSDVRPDGGIPPEGYFISDPIAVAKRVAAELEKECDIVVALGNLGSFKVYTKLVQEVEGVHFIFGSGGTGSYHQTIRSDKGWKALLFQTYAKGQYLGRIDLKILGGTHDFVDLRRKVYIERQIKNIESQLEAYRAGTRNPRTN